MRADGYVLISGPEGVPIEQDTRQCCHCGGHFVVVKGSGRKRGFCMKCMRVTCGAAACDACVPYEARIDRLETCATVNTRAGGRG